MNLNTEQNVDTYLKVMSLQKWDLYFVLCYEYLYFKNCTDCWMISLKWKA
jgi:hypothetical protein